MLASFGILSPRIYLEGFLKHMCLRIRQRMAGNIFLPEMGSIRSSQATGTSMESSSRCEAMTGEYILLEKMVEAQYYAQVEDFHMEDFHMEDSTGLSPNAGKFAEKESSSLSYLCIVQ